MKAMHDTLEREVKLEVPRSFRLPPCPGDALEPQTFTTRYFDAPDLRLARMGIALRRRVYRRKGIWQLELPGSCTRRNLECRGGPSGPPQDLRDILFLHLAGQHVVPVVTLRTRRTGMRIREGQGTVAEVTIDAVAVLEDGRVRGHFAEAKVELLNGDQEALDRLVTVLRAHGARETDQRPTIVRALHLEPPSPHPVPVVTGSAADELKAKLRGEFESLLAHDPGTRVGSDPEDLHQMRVAMRRLRAYLRAARPMLNREWTEGLRGELRWLGRALGPVRDLDVMVEYLEKELAVVPPQDRRGLIHLLTKLREERAEARGAMLSVLRSDRYLKLADRLHSAVAAPQIARPRGSLPQFAETEFRKLRKAMRGFTPDVSDQVLHGLRIRGKRARYAAELAERLMGKTVTRFLKQAKRFQDTLGEHQDAVATEARLRALLGRSRGSAAAFAAGIMVDRLQQRRLRARARVEKCWRKLERLGEKAFGGGKRARSTAPFRLPDPDLPESPSGFPLEA